MGNLFKVIKNMGGRLLLAGMFILPLMVGFSSPVAAAGQSTGAVYTQSNAADGNQVLAYDRATDGTLTFQNAYDTGGLGTGAGLGSQGALILSSNRRWLFTVNAGSNDISVFGVRSSGLMLASVTASGGTSPISLTQWGSYLYVLNAGDPGNITGFMIDSRGRLTPLAGSTQYLSNGGVGTSPGPAQISFTPDGSALVVTEKGTNLIDVFPVVNGIAGSATINTSNGTTPFGFSFDRNGNLIVSEAFGGAADASAVSSYAIDGTTLNVISPSVPDNQSAACWVLVVNRYAYTTNTGSSSLSSYRIRSDGAIKLLNATAGMTGDGSSPIDMALSAGGYVYALSGGTSTISAFQVMPDGSLAPVSTTSVMVGAVGLAAR
jgi:6-phosphogluconolactonase